MKNKAIKIKNFMLIALAWISGIAMILSVLGFEGNDEVFIKAFIVFVVSASYLGLFIYANTREG